MEQLMFDKLLTNKAYRRAGDAARGRGDWQAAAQSYRLHLDGAPDDAAIWVQLGHALKEQGKFRQAAEAYERASELRPTDEEVWLHLGHVLLRADRRSDAAAAFGRGHALGGSRESYEHATLLGVEARPPSAPDRDAATFLLLDDLLKFLADHVTLSGIQRTQVGILASLLADDPSGYRFLLTSDDRLRSTISFWEVPVPKVKQLIDYIATGVDLKRDVLNALLAEANRSSHHASFKVGDLVFILGAFWIIGKTAATLLSLKTAGATIGVYVYDLIPISHPEYCHAFLVEQFTRSFTEMVQFADFFATISKYVATVLADFIRNNELRPVPITPITLSHFLTVPDIDQPANEKFVQELSARLKGRPYSLYVSTLEGRKNHLYVLNAWQELMRRGVEMPELVFLGRKGWRIEGLMGFLDATGNLDGHVHLLHDIGDGDLAHLYRHCDFTLFTSMVEGWGLPVGESLVFGRPCVASGCCSIPEVGGDLVDYVDPMNLRDGIAVIERMSTDRAYRDRRARAIAERFKPRSWNDVADDFARLLRQVRSSPIANPAPFVVPPGTGYSLVWREMKLAELGNLLQYPNSLVLGGGFYDQEPGQVWMRGRSAVIDIPTILAEGARALVGFSLAVPPWNLAGHFALSPINVDGVATHRAARTFARRPGMPVVATVEVRVGPRGIASVKLEALDPTPHVEPDGREFYIGAQSLAYVQADKPSARADLLACFVNEAPFDSEVKAPRATPNKPRSGSVE